MSSQSPNSASTSTPDAILLAQSHLRQLNAARQQASAFCHKYGIKETPDIETALRNFIMTRTIVARKAG